MVLTCQRDALAASLHQLQVLLELLRKLRGDRQVQQPVAWLCRTGSTASARKPHSATGTQGCRATARCNNRLACCICMHAAQVHVKGGNGH